MCEADKPNPSQNQPKAGIADFAKEAHNHDGVEHQAN